MLRKFTLSTNSLTTFNLHSCSHHGTIICSLTLIYVLTIEQHVPKIDKNLVGFRLKINANPLHTTLEKPSKISFKNHGKRHFLDSNSVHLYLDKFPMLSDTKQYCRQSVVILIPKEAHKANQA